MSLRTKAILIVCAALITVIACLYVTSRLILINGLSQIEVHQTEESVRKVLNVFTMSIKRTQSEVADWAIWDETFEFIADGNQAYIDRNLDDSTFLNLNLSVILFLDNNDKLVYSKAYDIEKGMKMDVPPQLLSDSERIRIIGSLNGTGTGLSGVVLIDEKPMMFATSPILKSDFSGKIRGTLLFGRLLDDAELNTIGHLTLSDIDVRVTGKPMEPDFQKAMLSFAKNTVFTQVIDSKTVAGYLLVKDIHNVPAFILRTSEPRDAYMLGQNSIVYFVLSTLVIGMAVIFTVFFLLDKQVMSRFNVMLAGINKIRNTGEGSVRLPESGNDELTLFARTMNGLLESLAVSSSEIKAREERYRLLAEDVQKLYQQEKQLREELQNEINKRIEYTRGLVHELKTPITPILAASELLMEEIHEPPFDNLLKSINRSAQNLNRRIDELLDLARSEVSMLNVILEPVDLKALLQEVMYEMNPVAKSQKHILNAEIPAALPLVNADQDRIRQVVMNLLNNAIKYTPSGGTIAVRARRDVSEVIISVSDTGPGIPPEQQQRIFEPYYRVADARQKLSGLGLGLYLSKSLVTLHGGRIWVESEKGKGSTFSFSLPLIDGEKNL